MKKVLKINLKIIDQIEEIRAKNNLNWMSILRVAIINSPKETIKLLKKINSDDKKISGLIKKLKL